MDGNILVEDIRWKIVGGKYWVDWEGTVGNELTAGDDLTVSGLGGLLTRPTEAAMSVYTEEKLLVTSTIDQQAEYRAICLWKMKGRYEQSILTSASLPPKILSVLLATPQ